MWTEIYMKASLGGETKPLKTTLMIAESQASLQSRVAGSHLQFHLWSMLMAWDLLCYKVK